MSSVSRQKAHALLVDLAAHLAVYAKHQFGLSAAVAKDFGEDAAAYLADHWGGQHVYIPMDIAEQISSRDARIYADFCGDNQAELARKYKISEQHIYRIIKKERTKRSVKQHQLPV